MRLIVGLWLGWWQIAVADRLVEAEILDEKRLRKFVGKA